jgi:hypothetical protein
MVRHFVEQPLPSSFMLASITGFLVSVFVVWPLSMTWGFTFALVFLLWFIASVVNFTHAPSSDLLDIHNSEKLKKRAR